MTGDNKPSCWSGSTFIVAVSLSHFVQRFDWAGSAGHAYSYRLCAVVCFHQRLEWLSWSCVVSWPLVTLSQGHQRPCWSTAWACLLSLDGLSSSVHRAMSLTVFLSLSPCLVVSLFSLHLAVKAVSHFPCIVLTVFLFGCLFISVFLCVSLCVSFALCPAPLSILCPCVSPSLSQSLFVSVRFNSKIFTGVIKLFFLRRGTVKCKSHCQYVSI